jgi:hypothetical protein
MKESFYVKGSWITFQDSTDGSHTIPISSLRLHETLIRAATDETEGDSRYIIDVDGHFVPVDAVTFYEIQEWLMSNR